MDRRLFLIALNLIPHIQSKAVFALLDTLDDVRDICKLSKEELQSFPGIGEKTAERIHGFQFEEKLDKELGATRLRNIRIITRLDDEYPKDLIEIYSPPLVLYVQGELPSTDSVYLAVVGTRRATEYGKVAASKICGDLAEMGVVVISGMARGIDAVAHEAVLRKNGKTIAVLGSGLDVIYPSEHKRLYRKIVERGAGLAEFPLGTKPDKSNFPIRNRIISGLSFGTLIIEASEKSGTLITGRYALEQGRELFAVPGNITSRQSIGTNYLIKKGAKLVQRAEDIIDELPDHLQQRLTRQKKDFQTAQPEKRADVQFNEKERKILSLLEFDKPKHIDIVCSLLNEEPGSIWQHMLSLEIKNAVVQLEGKMFIKKFEG